MPQIFHPSMNTLSRVSIFGAVFILAGIVWLIMMIARSPYTTETGVIQTQPIPFSHAHHVGDVGIDCRYCHTSVEKSAFAGLPATSVCLNCHSQLWADSPLLAPVHYSDENDIPLRWTRVHDVPDYAYFNHSIHVAKGIGCVSCHGQVDQMPLMWRENSLHMEWCLDCHRNPEKHIRPKELVFTMKEGEELYQSDEWKQWLTENHPDQAEELVQHPHQLADLLVKKYGVAGETYRLTNCSTCHR